MTSSPRAALLVGLSLAAPACGPALDPRAIAAVQIESRREPPAGCRPLGPMEAKDTNRWVPNGPSREPAIDDLRRKAASAGANYVVIDRESPPRDTDYLPAFSVEARLFACASAAPSVSPSASVSAVSPAPRPSAAPVCEPDCSPGYTCLRGACVSACNPLCSTGERCGADRTCHAVRSDEPRAPEGASHD